MMEINDQKAIFLKEKLAHLFESKLSSFEAKFTGDIQNLEAQKLQFYSISKQVASLTNNDEDKEVYKKLNTQRPLSNLKVDTDIAQSHEKAPREGSKTPKYTLTTMATSPGRIVEVSNKVKKIEHQSKFTEQKRKSVTRNNSIEKDEKKPKPNPLIAAKRKSTKALLNTTFVVKSNTENELKDIKSQRSGKEAVKRPSVYVGKITDKMKDKSNLNKTMIEKPIKEDNVKLKEKPHLDKSKIRNLSICELPAEILSKEVKENIIVEEVQEKIKPKSIYKSNGLFVNSEFPSNNHRGLALMVQSGFLSFKQNIGISFLMNAPEEVKQIAIEKEFEILDNHNKKLTQMLENYEKDPKIRDALSKVFNPSKTALNSLNYLTKEEEVALLKSDQKEEVLNVLKLILLILNEEIVGLTNKQIPEFLLHTVLEKHKATSLKSLILNTVIRTDVSFSQVLKIKDFLQSKPSCFNSLGLIKINKSISYITFVLKDLCDFLLTKSEEGVYLAQVKDLKSIYERNVARLGKLKLLS